MFSAAGLKPDEKLHKLFLKGSKHTFRKGDMVMEGDTKHAFMIESGFIRAYNVNNRGDKFTHIIYAAYDMFPAYRVFDEDPHMHYEALGTTTLYALPRATLAQAVRTDLQICHSLLRVTTSQSRVFSARVRNLEFRHAPERVIYRLILMAERFGEQQPDGSYFIGVPMSQPVLASTINASRESVSRTMETLKNEGLISYDSKHIVVRDLAALKSRLNTIAKQ
ncbi:MAG TPA: Crp/Fnr family transcriptional regulator [Candidatus Saccharimonadales bacterium]|nr:Crp/Fnr family transcriptional regulator [Candidatus Saccharimonadales bacterium]